MMRTLCLVAVTLALVAPAGRTYHVVHGWPDLPDGADLKEISSVGVDSHDHVFVLTRDGRQWPDSNVLDKTPIAGATVFLLDGRSGKLLSQWGEKAFAMPHLLTIDGRDHVWVTDVAWHQVFEFSHDGTLLRTLGERGVAGADEAHFDQPTNVAVAPDGSFYVSDGYGNSRVVQFGADGRFVRQWGTKGTAAGQFNLPHGIAIDREGRVLVVDRGNKRVQVFDARGAYLTEWKGPPFGSPQAIAAGPDGAAYVADSGSVKLPDPCGIVVLGRDGAVTGHAGRYGYYDGQFADIHGVAVAKNGDLYVADFAGKRVQKFVR
jgi:peptidylamidoglycolate lyase